MKKWISILGILLMSLTLAMPLNVSAHPDRMVDQADLLSEDEEARVRQELNVISEELLFDIAVVTVDSTDGQDIQDFADDYYDYNGYGFGEEYDGAMLVINMEEREWYITTCGYGIVAMPSEDINYIAEEFLAFLSAGEYEEAFLGFATSCQVYVNEAREAGVEYDEEYYEDYSDYYDEDVVAPVEKETSIIGVIGKLMICLAVGFVLAFIPMAVMKGKMKTVELKKEAQDYLVRNSRKLTVSRDRFMYHTINRVARPKDTPNRSGGVGGGGVHISSSGRSHGGGGGRF